MILLSTIISTIKNNLTIGLIIVSLTLGGLYYTQRNATEAANDRWSTEVNNHKADNTTLETWKDRYGQEHAKTIMFKESLDNFKTSKDSTTLAMLAIIKQQGYKLSNIQQVGYQRLRIDTTILRHVKSINGDTTIDFSDRNLINQFIFKNGTASSHIGLIDSAFTIASAHKETIDPPKKFFLWRWFQNKQYVISIDNIHTNPLIKTDKQKFILINDNIKKANK